MWMLHRQDTAIQDIRQNVARINGGVKLVAQQLADHETLDVTRETSLWERTRQNEKRIDDLVQAEQVTRESVHGLRNELMVEALRRAEAARRREEEGRG